MLEVARTVFHGKILRHIHFAADDRLNVVLFAQLGKIERRIHVAVIGDRERLHVVFDAVLHKVVNLARAVEQAVFGMKM